MTSLALRNRNNSLLPTVTFGNSIDRWFDDVDHWFNNSTTKHQNMKVDFYENDTAYIVSADVPGVTVDDIDVSLENGILTISCKRSNSVENGNDDYYVRERIYGEMKRAFKLPTSVKEDSIDAKLNNGVLTVTIDKGEELKRRQIEVKSG